MRFSCFLIQFICVRSGQCGNNSYCKQIANHQCRYKEAKTYKNFKYRLAYLSHYDSGKNHCKCAYCAADCSAYNGEYAAQIHGVSPGQNEYRNNERQNVFVPFHGRRNGYFLSVYYKACSEKHVAFHRYVACVRKTESLFVNFCKLFAVYGYYLFACPDVSS